MARREVAVGLRHDDIFPSHVIHVSHDSHGTYGLLPSRFHELDRGPEQRKMLFVFGHVGAVELYPFPRAGHAAGRERDDVVPRELQLGRRGYGQAQSDTVAADAGEHLVADEIGIQAVDLSCDDAREAQ